MTAVDTPAPAPAGTSGSATSGAPLTRGAGLGLGVTGLWLSLAVLLPLAAIAGQAFADGPGHFWAEVTTPEALDTVRLTVGCAVLATVVNAVLGTLVAWVLVRDDFPGKRLLEVVIDVPFALPTIVAGLVLISLYGPQGPVGINLVGTRAGIGVALLFVTLPFVVRSVQPVLLETERDVEEAAASLGADGFTIFRRIVLPTIAPAVLAGSALAFARALGEYGSVVLISANLPGRTEVSSSYILKRIEEGDPVAASAVATLLLAVAVVVLLLLDVLHRRAVSRG